LDLTHLSVCLLLDALECKLHEDRGLVWFAHCCNIFANNHAWHMAEAEYSLKKRMSERKRQLEYVLDTISSKLMFYNLGRIETQTLVWWAHIYLVNKKVKLVNKRVTIWSHSGRFLGTRNFSWRLHLAYASWASKLCEGTLCRANQKDTWVY